jgi:ATP synthase subunit 6
MYTEIILLCYSPLEQFQNISCLEDNYSTNISDLYSIWNHAAETRNLFDSATLTDYKFTNQFFYDSNFLIILHFAMMYSLIGILAGVDFIKNKANYIQIFISWLVIKLFLYMTSFINISSHYINANIAVPVEEQYFSGTTTITQFATLEDHGGFLFTDSFVYFLTALFFLYLCTAFQDLNNTAGPFIVSSSIILYIQLVIHRVTVELLSSSIDKNLHTQKYQAFIYSLFVYLIIANLQGLIPFNITVTSHLITTFFLALAIIIFITLTILSQQGILYFFSLFMPTGAPLPLGYLLIPIELISFFFKTVSLSVRLFANMMAGHTLLKVILGFAWALLNLSEIYFIVNFFPIIILILLTVLELGVSLIQAYIFTILTTLYLRDAYSGH